MRNSKKNDFSKQNPHVFTEDFDELKTILNDPQEIKIEKRKILKSLLLICVAFLFNFISFGGASSLQSSLNDESGLGTGSLAIIYGALIVSAVLTPSFLIAKLGCKWTVCFSIVGYATYPLANFYPVWGTLVPSSVIVGAAAAPLWAAKSTYLTTAASRYARLSNESVDTVVNRFFGIFFLFFQLNNIIGQLISSFVLSGGDTSNLILPDCYNETYINTYCGKNDCQKNFAEARKDFNSTSCPITPIQSEGVEDSLLYTLMGIYAGIGLLGALVVGLFVDPLTIRAKETRGFFDLLIATIKHLKDTRQLLLIFITAYSGFEQAFLTGDITRSFVSCPLAVNWIGFVLLCYGACDSICSLLFGRIEKYTGRIVLFFMAFSINIALIAVFQIWLPYPSNSTLFFILPAFWGIADAVWQTQLNALYGVFFISNQEAGFANYRLWESVGFVIAFAYQSALCVSVKLWILLGVLLIGMTLYCVAEYFDKVQQKKIAGKKNDLDEKMTAENEAYVIEETISYDVDISVL